MEAGRGSLDNFPLSSKGTRDRQGCVRSSHPLPRLHCLQPTFLPFLPTAVLKSHESLAQPYPTPDTWNFTATPNSNESLAQTNLTQDIWNFTGGTKEERYEQLIQGCWYFHKNLMDSIEKDWCDWAIISSPYSILRSCLERTAEGFGLAFPNPWAERIILKTHQIHFASCSLGQPTFSDPPEGILLAMIIAPICLIPFLVTLVVWKSKDSEAQT